MCIVHTILTINDNKPKSWKIKLTRKWNEEKKERVLHIQWSVHCIHYIHWKSKRRKTTNSHPRIYDEMKFIFMKIICYKFLVLHSHTIYTVWQKLLAAKWCVLLHLLALLQGLRTVCLAFMHLLTLFLSHFSKSHKQKTIPVSSIQPFNMNMLDMFFWINPLQTTTTLCNIYI